MRKEARRERRAPRGDGDLGNFLKGGSTAGEGRFFFEKKSKPGEVFGRSGGRKRGGTLDQVSF